MVPVIKPRLSVCKKSALSSISYISSPMLELSYLVYLVKFWWKRKEKGTRNHLFSIMSQKVASKAETQRGPVTLWGSWQRNRCSWPAFCLTWRYPFERVSFLFHSFPRSLIIPLYDIKTAVLTMPLPEHQDLKLTSKWADLWSPTVLFELLCESRLNMQRQFVYLFPITTAGSQENLVLDIKCFYKASRFPQEILL